MEIEMKRNLAGFYRVLLEAERAGVQTITHILQYLEDEKLKMMITKYLRDEGMNCQILIALIKNLDGDPGNKTGDFLQKIMALNTIEEKLELLVKGQEWVSKQIRYNRELIDTTSDRFFLEAMKIQHEENIDAMKKILNL